MNTGRFDTKIHKARMLLLYAAGALFPLIIHVKEYVSLLSSFVWETKEPQLDMYIFWKTKVMLLFGALCLFFIILDIIRGKTVKRIPAMYYLLAAALVPAGISAFVSKNKGLTVFVGDDTGLTFPVLLSCLIFLAFSYLTIESMRDIKCICLSMTIGGAVSAVWGMLQFFDVHPVEWDLVQRLTLGGLYDEYAGELFDYYDTRAIAGMGNPDTAGVYFLMLLPVALFLVIYCKKTCVRIYSLIAFLLMGAAAVMTAYRGVFIAAGAAAVLMLPLFWKRAGRIKAGRPVLLGAMLILVLCAGDVLFNRGILTQITDDPGDVRLYDIQTKDNCLYLYISSDDVVCIKLTKGDYSISHIKDGAETDVTGLYDPEEEFLGLEGYEDMVISPDAGDGRPSVYVLDGYCSWHFELKKGRIVYINHVGRKEKIEKAKALLSEKWDYVGSGRWYIWSRTLPLLKDKLLLGSGPCTFASVFPQNDYIAKAKAFGMNALIISKADNAYLSFAVEYGMLSLILIVLFAAAAAGMSYRHLQSENEGFGIFFLAAFMTALINGVFVCANICFMPALIVTVAVMTVLVQRKGDSKDEKHKA